jgi:nucleoside-diphosphate-sugar epimerase
MRVLIVGGTGFIGPYVVRRLAAMGHEVAVFHRGTSGMALPVEHIIGDWRDLPRLRPRAGIVINLILSSAAQAREFMDTFRGVARRVIAASSIDVYRACGVLHGSEDGPLQATPLTEDSQLRTKGQTYPPEQIERLRKIVPWVDDEYDKIPVERTILGDRELPGTVLRLPMIYGPGDYVRRFHPVLKRIDDGRRAILLQEVVADWRSPRGYVENVAEAIALAAVDDRAAGRIYNVAETPAFSEMEWARKIARATGWTGEFVVLPKDTIPPHLKFPGNAAQHWEADSSRIRNELGYCEPIAVDEGIRRTIEWERANPPTLPLPYSFDYEVEDGALAALTRSAR